MEVLHISTMTGTSEIDSNINLDNLFNNVNPDSIIHYIQHGSLGIKGKSNKPKRNSRKPTPKKSFFNQVTLHVNCEKIVNVKLFNNGKVQMTGLKYENHGSKVLELLIPYLLKLDQQSDRHILDKTEIIHNPMNIACINSNFSIGYPIKRDILHREIVDLGYYSSYEPCIYPGVNIKYYYNSATNDGICKCNVPCNGKGDGSSNGKCKKITIAVFQSGEAIITGARSKLQLDISHKFITDLIKQKQELLRLN